MTYATPGSIWPTGEVIALMLGVYTSVYFVELAPSSLIASPRNALHPGLTPLSTPLQKTGGKQFYTGPKESKP